MFFIEIKGKKVKCNFLPGSKLGNFGIVGNLENFFSEIFKSKFSIFPYSQNRKLGNKKTRNNISEISKNSKISEFLICHFSIFQRKIFVIFWSRQFCTLYLCYLLYSKPFKVLFLSAEIYNVHDNYHVVKRCICCKMYLY